MGSGSGRGRDEEKVDMKAGGNEKRKRKGRKEKLASSESGRKKKKTPPQKRIKLLTFPSHQHPRCPKRVMPRQINSLPSRPNGPLIGKRMKIAPEEAVEVRVGRCRALGQEAVMMEVDDLSLHVGSDRLVVRADLIGGRGVVRIHGTGKRHGVVVDGEDGDADGPDRMRSADERATAFSTWRPFARKPGCNGALLADATFP